VVKRQTSPRSGWFALCRFSHARAVSTRSRVLTELRWTETGDVGRHHTRMEGLPPGRWRWPRDVVPSSATEKPYLCPHTVLGTGGAARLSCTSEGQGRVRGSPRPPSVTLAVYPGAGAGVQSTAPGQGPAPLRSGAFADAPSASWQSAVARRIPWGPRSAPGSPTPRPHVLSNLSRSNAVARFPRSYPARAHVWARLGNALPWPGCFSTRRRDFSPPGLCRRDNPAASEQAPLRSA
jgi:hypothetical protein